MAKFNFNLRDKKSKGETAIYLVVRWDKNRLVYPSGESINPKFWEDDKSKRSFQRAKETKQFPEYPEFNRRLDFIETSAKNVFRQFVNDNGLEPETDVFKALLNKEFKREGSEDGISKKKDLFSFIEKFIEEAGKRVNPKTGKALSYGIMRVYINTLSLLKEFGEIKRKRIDFDTIDLDFYHDFSDFLTKTRGFANNNVGKHIKTLKTFLNDATERGWNTNLAYKSKRFRVLRENTDSIYLSEKELEELFSLDLSKNLRLDRVRDLFLVGCWTGLRFSDFSTIEPENIKGDFIEIETQKTAEVVVIPIHPTVQKIMEKYKGEYPNSLPPSISNVKMNQYLKELGMMVKSLHAQTSTSITKGGVNRTTNFKKYELLTTHTARRSFATNLYIDGLSSITIMKITGHRTEKAFLQYIKVTPNENAKILQMHWQKKQKLRSV